MQKLRKLPFLLAVLVTLFAAACSEADVTPRSHEDDETPIIIYPSKTNTASADTVSI